MNQVSELIEAMCSAVPAGRESLDEQEISLLRPLTYALLSEMPESESEYQRYLAVTDRTLPIPMEKVGNWLRDKTVLVTGGTGCIGSALIARLLELGARRVVSVSRGITEGWPRLAGVEYRKADVRDQPVLTSVLADVKPDVLFHVAAQRDPGLAELAVHHTVTTNVLGTYNVIAAAERTGVPRIVFASTGKTVIPYTADIYATSKRITEWLAANAAGRGDILCSAARFTHIVDNSILSRRIAEGCDRGLLRIHRPDSAFYVQSAAESAQLLIYAGFEPEPGVLDVHAIGDLGWPIDLLSLALGALSHSDSKAAIYFSGPDPGYRGNMPFAGQYDPEASWEVGPLINAFEARTGRKSDYGQVDVFPRLPLPDAALESRFRALATACAETREPALIRRQLDELSWAVFEQTLDAVPIDELLRIHNSGISGSDPEGLAHPRILAAIKSRAAAYLASQPDD